MVEDQASAFFFIRSNSSTLKWRMHRRNFLLILLEIPGTQEPVILRTTHMMEYSSRLHQQ